MIMMIVMGFGGIVSMGIVSRLRVFFMLLLRRSCIKVEEDTGIMPDEEEDEDANAEEEEEAVGRLMSSFGRFMHHYRVDVVFLSMYRHLSV